MTAVHPHVEQARLKQTTSYTTNEGCTGSGCMTHHACQALWKAKASSLTSHVNAAQLYAPSGVSSPVELVPLLVTPTWLASEQSTSNRAMWLGEIKCTHSCTYQKFVLWKQFSLTSPRSKTKLCETQCNDDSNHVRQAIDTWRQNSLM